MFDLNVKYTFEDPHDHAALKTHVKLLVTICVFKYIILIPLDNSLFVINSGSWRTQLIR